MQTRTREPKSHSPAAGIALTAVLVSLTAAAAIVGALYTLSTAASRRSIGIEHQLDVRAFADGVAGLCDSVLDSTFSLGDYQVQGAELPFVRDGLLEIGDLTVTQLDQLSSEIATAPNALSISTAQWSQDVDAEGHYSPDFSFTYRHLRATLDVDQLRDISTFFEVNAAGNFQEFGGASRQMNGDDGAASEEQSLGLYRCFVHAVDTITGRQAMVTGFARKYK